MIKYEKMIYFNVNIWILIQLIWLIKKYVKPYTPADNSNIMACDKP